MAEEPPTSEQTANIQAATSQDSGGDRPWERAWTLDEMRKGADRWTLAGDAGLLLYLQEFSQKMISRTHEIEKEVASLIHESKLTGVRVNNAFNDFMMLANTQFVENRVYVDDEEIQEKNAPEEKKSEEQEKSREQRESELIPKVTEAIKLGVNVIEEAFEKLDTNVDNTDSEDEDESYRVDPILEAKDPYVDRLLPHLIGSPNFMNDDDVGLKDISDEESDAGSISESESEEEDEKDDKEQESEYSYSDSMSDDSETEKPKWREKIMHSDDDDDEDSDSEGDLFGDTKKQNDEGDETEESDVEEKEQSQDKISSQEPVDFQAELARKLGGGALPKPPTPRIADGDENDVEDDMSKSTEKQKKKKKKEKEKKRHKTKSIDRGEDDLFQPEKDNSDDDLFGGGMFAKKSGGLFDKEDESDEGNMFGDSVQKRKESVKKVEEKEDQETEEEEEAKGKLPMLCLLLFGDSVQKRKESVKKVEEKEDQETEEEEEAKEEVVTDKKRGRTASGKKIPAGGVSIFGGAAIQKSSGGGGLFDDDDEDDLFNSTSKPKSDSLSEKTAEQKSVPAPKSGRSGLFADDDEDDDLFGGKPPTSTVVSKPPSKQQDSKKLSLFDDDEEEDGDFTTSVVEPKSKPIDEKKEPAKKKLPAGAVSMFGPGGLNPIAAALKKQRPGSDEEDDDWSDGEKSRSGSLKSNQSTASKSSVQSLSSKPKSNSFSRNAISTPGIFDEDEGDDLFGSNKQPTSTKQPEKKKIQEEKPRSGSLFDDDDDGEEEDLFGSKPAAKPKEQTKKRPAGAVSLFPGGLDPFGKKEKQEQEPKKEQKREDKKEEPPKKAAVSFFGDDEAEDGLFGGVDTKTASAPVKQVSTGKAKSMFDDDDDDLFGSKQDDLFSKPPEPAKSLPTEPTKVEQKKVDTTTSVTKVTKPKATKPAASAGLFGDDEEEGDLFGKPVAPKETTDMDKSESPKPQHKKPPVGGVSMFGPGAGALLPGLKKKQDKPEDEQADVKQDKGEEIKSLAKKPVDPLFGDDGEEDDLFGGGPVKKQEVKPVPKKEEVKPVKPTSLITPPPLDNGILDNLDDDNDDDDLFGTGKRDEKKTDEAKQPDSPTEAKPKKPVGGVSMFGGVNPFAGRVKKQAEAEPVLGASTDMSSPEDDLFSSSTQKPKVETKKVDPIVPKENKSPATGKIGKLQANLNFNPAAMLPGAAPPTKEPEPIGIGFDVPAEARTLQSANKDRAKIQTKRRPPSRVARQRASAQSPDRASDDFFSSPTSPLSPKSPDLGFDSSRIPPPISDSPPRVPSPMIQSASPRKTDMFGNEDLFGGTSPKSTTKSVIEPRSTRADTSDIFSSNAFVDKKDKTQSDNLEDLFASPSRTSAIKSNVNVEQNDDLFNDVGKTVTDSKPKLLTNNDDDNLFSSPALSKSKIKEEKRKEPEKSDEKASERKSKPVIVPEDDDLFSTPALTKAKDKTNSTAKGNPGMEEDIFGDSSLNKKKEEQKKTEISAEATENDDDIFAVTKPEKRTKPKKAMTKDEDLFDDKTDIFDDIPKAKPKEKKVKKKTAAPKKQIFKDDIDDIFADTTALSKPKEKKKEKKKATDTAKSVTKDKGKSLDDIFDDPLS